MASTYEYIISLQDKMSGTMSRIIGASAPVVSQLESMSVKAKNLQGITKDLGGSIYTLKQRIDLLQQEKELIDPSNLKLLKQYNKEIAGLEGQISQLDNAGRKKGFLGGIGEKLGQFINPQMIAGAAIGFMGKSAMSFDESMAQVNVTAQFEGDTLEKLKTDLKSMAKANKLSINVAPEGFEKILSQTDDVEMSLDILDAAMKGSKAGFTELDVVASALAQSMSVIGKGNASAREVLDTFLTAKRVGAGEFSDFARYLPGMIAGASNLGIAYKEVAGTYAYMTGKGQSAEKAAVLMENAFKVLGKSNVRQNLAKAGVNVFDDKGEIRGMVDIFSDLSSVMNQLNGEQKSQFLEGIGLIDKEAKNAFALLTSDMEKFSETMKDTVNSSGETDRALAFSANSMQKMTDVWNKFKNVGFEIGETLLPFINAGLSVLDVSLSDIAPVVSAIATAFSWWFSELHSGNPLIWGLTTAIAYTTIVLNAAAIAQRIKATWDGIVAVSTKIWTAAQWALNTAFWACPLTWIIAAIAALVAAIAWCVTSVEGWGKQWDVIVNFMTNSWNLFTETFKFTWNTLISGFQIGLDKIKLGWYKFKEAVGIGDSATNMEMIRQINEDIENRKAAIIEGANKIKELTAKTASSLTWELSIKKDKAEGTATQSKESGDTSSTTGGSGALDFNSLMSKMSKGKGKGKNKVLDLGDTANNLKGTASYSSIVSRLNPVKLASLSSAVAAAALPVVMSTAMPEDITSPDMASSEYTEDRRSVQMEKFCDSLVINIANADNKGYDQIREEIETAMTEFFDTYEA